MRFLRPLILFVTLLTTPARSEGLCDGRYAVAEEMLDAAYGKYGTLYSGGNHWHQVDNVGADIDLWRLWTGLPDLKFREASSYGGMPWNFYLKRLGWANKVEQRVSDLQFEIAIELAHVNSATPLPLSSRYMAASWLDFATMLGSSPDWWLDSETQTEGTPNSHPSAVLAKKVPLIHWLYLLQSASNTPSSVAWFWADKPALPDSITRDARDLAEQEPDNLARQAAVAVTARSKGAFDGYRSSKGEFSGYRKLRGKVVDCTATPAEYALFAVQQLEIQRIERQPTLFSEIDLLPPKMRAVVIQQTAMKAISRAGTWYTESRTLLDRASQVANDPEFAAWINVGRTYLAASVDDLINIHRGQLMDARTMRALNVLSVADLSRFLAGAEIEGQDRRQILTALATRNFVLGDILAAREHAFALAVDSSAPQLELIDILHGPGDEEVQVARTLLHLSDVSVWMRGVETFHFRDVGIYYRNSNGTEVDLPQEFASVRFLERDLNVWLLLDPGAYRHMRGYSIESLDRLNARGRLRQFYDEWAPAPLNFLPTGPGWTGFRFSKLIAWDEIANLGACHGLSKRLAEVIITWADEGTDGWIDHYFAPSEAMADALRKIILMGRHNSGALVNGEPAGQVAMRLLQSRFADTEAAKKTKYWYFEDHGCKP